MNLLFPVGWLWKNYIYYRFLAGQIISLILHMSIPPTDNSHNCRYAHHISFLCYYLNYIMARIICRIIVCWIYLKKDKREHLPHQCVVIFAICLWTLSSNCFLSLLFWFLDRDTLRYVFLACLPPSGGALYMTKKIRKEREMALKRQQTRNRC